MNPKMLEALREIFGPQGSPPAKSEVFDIPSPWCRESLDGLRDALAVLTSSVLVGSEGTADCADCHAKTLEWLKLEASRCHDEAWLPPYTSMDWPDVKRELVTLLKATLEAVNTGHEVVKPVPRSAEAIEIFGLDQPKPEADFLKPQMADPRAFGRTPTSPGYREMPPPVHGEAEAKAEQTIAQAFAKPPHGGYPEPMTMAQTVAQGRPEIGRQPGETRVAAQDHRNGHFDKMTGEFIYNPSGNGQGQG